MIRVDLRRLARCAAISFALLAYGNAFIASANAEPQRLALFDFELIDSSLEGPQAAQDHRLAMIDQRLRDALAKSDRYALVDIGPVRPELGTSPSLHSCNGCDLDYGRKLGATLVMAGTVQKVSNLILNLNLYLKDVATGRTLAGGSVDIRGNTDESWNHGLDYLLRNRLDLK